MNFEENGRYRRGSIFVLVAVLIVAFFALTALAVDLGYAVVARGEIQNAADSACMAGAEVLFDRDLLKGMPNQDAEIAAAQLNAGIFARANANYFSGQELTSGSETTSYGYSVPVNSGFTVASGDGVIGYYADPNDTSATMQFNSGAAPTPFSPPVLFYVPPTTGDYTSAVPQLVGSLPMPEGTALDDVANAATSVLAPPAVNTTYNMYNSAQFTVSRTESSANGALEVFFAKVMPGNDGKVDIETRATGTWEDNVKGFRIRTDTSGFIVGSNVSKLLPFAMDVNTFGAMAAGMSTIDLFIYDPNGGPVVKPVYPGTPPDYRNRLSMSNEYVAWLLDTHPPTSLTAENVLKWDKLDPFNAYNRTHKFVTGSLVDKIFDADDPLGSSFNPWDPTIYSGLMPGDGIKEALLIPLTLQRRQFTSLSDPLLGIYLPLTAGETVTGAAEAVHVGNFGCLYLGTSAPADLQAVASGVATDLGNFERQVVYGLNQTDFSQMGGRLQLNASGHVMVRGTTIVPTALKSILRSIRGQPRIIPLYQPTTSTLLPSNVTGSLYEAEFKIVGFAGVTILEVYDIPNPHAIDVYGYSLLYYLDNLKETTGPLSAELQAIYDAEEEALDQANSLKVLIQPEFVIDATAIGGGSQLNIGAGRKTSAFVYKPLVITH